MQRFKRLGRKTVQTVISTFFFFLLVERVSHASVSSSRRVPMPFALPAAVADLIS